MLQALVCISLKELDFCQPFSFITRWLGAVHKRRLQSDGCLVRTFCGQREEEVLQMRTSSLFCAKKLRIFRKLWCVRTDKGELSECGQIANKMEGVFVILCERRL